MVGFSSFVVTPVIVKVSSVPGRGCAFSERNGIFLSFWSGVRATCAVCLEESATLTQAPRYPFFWRVWFSLDPCTGFCSIGILA